FPYTTLFRSNDSLEMRAICFHFFQKPPCPLCLCGEKLLLCVLRFGRGIPMKKMPIRERLQRIIGRLREVYPDAHCELEFETPFQLLVATILSAQCTDKRVNIVTRELFKKYPTARELAAANQEELEQAIKSTGFYRSK